MNPILKRNVVGILLIKIALLTGCDPAPTGLFPLTANTGGSSGKTPEPPPTPECVPAWVMGADAQESLGRAISVGEASCIKRAIELGANPALKIPRSVPGQTAIWPVHLAIEGASLLFSSATGRDYFILKLLVDSGADLNAKNENGETALQVMLKRESVFSYPEVAKYIIQSGKADIEIQDEEGNTPLLLAINLDHSSLVEDLLTSGANPNASTKSGTTALRLAIRKGSEASAILLTALGADTTKVDNFGNTYLHLAAESKKNEFASVLLSQHPNLDLKNSDGKTALLIAIENKANDLAQEILKNGASVNLSDNSGRTPLDSAVAQKPSTATQVELVKALIKAGAIVNAKDKNGETPLHHVNSANVLKLLLEAGADRTLKNLNGATPLAIHKARQALLEDRKRRTSESIRQWIQESLSVQKNSEESRAIEKKIAPLSREESNIEMELMPLRAIVMMLSF